MNATLDVIQGLRDSGAIPDGNARAYVRQAIAAGVSRSTHPRRAHSPRSWQTAPSAAQYGLSEVDFAAMRQAHGLHRVRSSDHTLRPERPASLVCSSYDDDDDDDDDEVHSPVMLCHDAHPSWLAVVLGGANPNPT